MVDPLFWLGLSILLVAVSLAAVLIAALPALQELARAARSAEKLFDTLSRELPPTLEAIRLTGIEITNLTEDVGQNVQSAGRVVEQVDQSLSSVKQQARQARVTTQSVVAGFKAAWQTFTKPAPSGSTARFSTLAEDPDDRQLTGNPSAFGLSNNTRTGNPFESALAEADLLEEEPLPYSDRGSRRSSAFDAKPSINPSEPRRLRSDRHPRE